MNELQRQAYLKAMGVELYFPRLPLSGARPSPHYDVGALTAESEPTQADHSLDARKMLAAALEKPTASLVPAKPAKAAMPANPAPATETSPPPPSSLSLLTSQQQEPAVDTSATADELKFSLRYYKISPQLAVVDEIPHQQAQSGQSAAIALLKAILLALEVDISACDFQPESLSWPLAEELMMKNDPRVEASNALLGFIRVRKDLDDFENLLVFGSQIDELLMAQRGDLEQRDFQATGSDYFITLSNSLQSVLAYPQLKRDVWRQLQLLRLRLAADRETRSSKIAE